MLIGIAYASSKTRRTLSRSACSLAIGTVLLSAACGSGESSGASTAGSAKPLVVSAAASLTEVLPRIDPAARYQFAGSDQLARQIREGAPADVYAAASSKYPQELYAAGLVEEPLTFASNRLVLIVPRGNPRRIGVVADVMHPGTKLVVAAEGVPAGDYARDALEHLHLSRALRNVVSNEDDVKGVVAKVSLGEADAGFVYATDAAAAGGHVTLVELPKGSQPPIYYQIAVVKRRGDEQAARAFVRRVLGPAGRRALSAGGFVPAGSRATAR